MDAKGSHMKKTLFLICFLSTMGTPVFARTVEPLFTGTWFGDDALPQDVMINNCNEPVWYYPSLGTDPDAMAENFARTTSQENCSTGHCTVQYEVDWMDGDPPRGFPSTRYIYSYMLKTGAPRIRLYEIQRDADPTHIFSYFVYPRYICPPGTRQTDNPPYPGNNWSNLYCNSLPPLCQGDIVGRDVDLKGISSLGHVGVTLGKTSIANVLPADPFKDLRAPDPHLLKVTDFSTFINTTHYWGDKYGLPIEPEISTDEGSNITSIAMSHFQYSGYYTFGNLFTPAPEVQPTQVYDVKNDHWLPTEIPIIEKWRCDTFADWVYFMGTQQQILPMVSLNNGSYKYNSFWQWPKTLYKTLLNTRDNGQTAQSSQDKQADNQVQNTSLHINQLMMEKKEMAVMYFAAKMEQLAENKKLSRSERLQTLTQLLNEQPDDWYFISVADALCILNPIEMVPQLIAQYTPNASIGRKERILNVLESAADADPAQFTVADKANLVQFQQFISQQLQQEKDPELLYFVIHAYNHVTPFSQAKVDAITQALTLTDNTTDIGKNQHIMELFTLAINAPNDKLMQSLIEQIQQSSPTQQDAFQLLLESMVSNPKNLQQLPADTHDVLTKYIRDQLLDNAPVPAKIFEHLSQVTDTDELMNSKAVYIQYYALVKAYGFLMDNSQIASDFIMQIQDPMLQAEMVHWAHLDHNPAIYQELDQPALLQKFQQIVSTMPDDHNYSISSPRMRYVETINLLNGLYAAYMKQQAQKFAAKTKN